MADRRDPLLGALEAERFFGREQEITSLRRLARDLSRGWGKSLYLFASPGAGKTELLKQLFGTLFWEEGDVVPFYYAFPHLEWELRDFARDFVCTFAAQYLAFKKRDPSLLTRPAGTHRLFERLRAEEREAGAFLAESYRFFEDLPPGLSPALEASRFAHRFSEACGWKVMSLLDDFFHLRNYRPAPLTGWSKEAFRSRVASVIVTGRHPAQLGDPLEGEELIGVVESRKLDPLSCEGADRMLRSLLRVAGVEIEDRLQRILVRQLRGSPHYLESVVRSLPSGVAVGPEAVQRTYASSVCRGELHNYWLRVLTSAVPELQLRRTALELLVFCLREGFPPPDVGRLAAQMMKPRTEVEEALAGLRRAGLVRVDCARAAVLNDPVLRDFVFALYRREYSGVGHEIVEASMVAEKLIEGAAVVDRIFREDCRRSVKGLLELWSGQRVPRLLFSTEDFDRKFGDQPGDDLLDRLQSEQDVLSLPRVVSVASGAVGQETGLPPFEVDAMAWAFQGRGAGREVCWVVRVLTGKLAGEVEVEEFEHQVAALQTSGALPVGRLVKWLILTEGLDPEGRRLSARYRILTSTAVQVQLLGRCLGREDVLLRSREAKEEGDHPTLEFEMSIPMVSETELVAVRAIEQLAENMNFSEGEIGKIKMALVEACINAFEHSGFPEGKVRLFFSVSRESLRIRVENLGRRFSPAEIAPRKAAPKLQKRGWGLSLIRELMDEVEFESRPAGTSLIMVKHLATKEGNRE